MKFSKDVRALDDALTDLAKLYQFRSLEEPLYGGLTVSQSYTLRSLYFQGQQSMSALAAGLGVRLSTMTGVVDQLESRELVERVDHPDDRRSLQVRLTLPGRKLYQVAHEAFLAQLSPLLRDRSDADIEQVLSFLTEVTQTMQSWRENVRRKEP
jgi:DNA-binding MarR family transcriptional regulator